MRPVRLELEGFRSYRKAQALEFPQRGLLAITGPTGSGKSSLLEAMVFALFGCPSGGGRSNKDLIAQGCEDLRVSLEFEVRGRRLVARRSIARRGSGHFELREGELLRAQDGPSLNREIESLLGLDREQFQKSVLLPQGAFHELLTSRAKERGELLKRLLHLDAYEPLEARLQGALTRARQVVERAEGLRLRLPEHPQQRLAQCQQELQDCLQRRRQRGKGEMLRWLQLRARLGAGAGQRLADEIEELRRVRARVSGQELDPFGAELVALEGELAGVQAHQSELEVRCQQARHQWQLWCDYRHSQQRLASLQVDAEGLRAEAARLELLLQVARSRTQQVLARHLASGRLAGDPCPVCQSPWSAQQPLSAPADNLDWGLREQEELLLQLGACRSRLAGVEAEIVELQGRPMALPADDPAPLEQEQQELQSRLQRLEAQRWSIHQEQQRAQTELQRQRLEHEQQLAALERIWREEVAEPERAARELRPRCLEILGLATDCSDEELERIASLEAGDGASWEGADELPGWSELDQQLGRAEQRLEEARHQLAEVERLEQSLGPARAQLERLQRLSRLLSYQRNKGLALTFPQWLLVQRQGELLGLASDLLEQLSCGQFRLGCESDDVSALQVLHLPSGRSRPVATLSGGETFLASLALAVALSELAGRSGGRVEALFLDEGFGTLSQEHLDRALQALEMLARGRLIGLISHVPLVAERVDTCWLVARGVDGSRVTRAPSRLRRLVEPAPAEPDPRHHPLFTL